MAEETICSTPMSSMSKLCSPDAGNFSRRPQAFPWNTNLCVGQNEGNTSVSFMDMLKER